MMKIRKKNIFLVAALLVTFLLLAACANSIAKDGGTYFLMDTVVTTEITDKKAEEINQQILEELEQFENQYSMYIGSSDIARINEAAGENYVQVEQSTYEMLKRAVELCAQSDGKFDITIGPLIDLWDIKSEDPKVPHVTEELLELIDYKDILFQEEDTSIMLVKKGQRIDLGGIAKGAACDQIEKVYQSVNPDRALVSLGGNIVGTGQKEFRIGIQDPRGSDYMGIVEMKEDQIIATSGDYQRFFEVDNKRYHHILNPQTGQPVDSDFVSVSVLHQDGLMGDYLSTLLFMKSKEELLSLSDTYSFIAIDHQNTVYLSDDLQGKFEIVKNEYQQSK